MCKNQNCDMYPYYGLAPHKHVGVLADRPETMIRSTVIKPKEAWPKNFEEDPESPGCGVYYCPDCLERKSSSALAE